MRGLRVDVLDGNIRYSAVSHPRVGAAPPRFIQSGTSSTTLAVQRDQNATRRVGETALNLDVAGLIKKASVDANKRIAHSLPLP